MQIPSKRNYSVCVRYNVMECTVDVKKLPSEMIDKLKDNLQQLKLFRASNEMLLNTYDKEWRELFDALQPVAQAAIDEIIAYNTKQCSTFQRIKRVLTNNTSSNYKNVPYLLQSMADGSNWGIKMPCASTTNYDLVSSCFDSANAEKVNRMRLLSRDYSRSASNINNVVQVIRQIEAVITAAETEYASVPNITLSTLENLLNPKEISQ